MQPVTAKGIVMTRLRANPGDIINKWKLLRYGKPSKQWEAECLGCGLTKLVWLSHLRSGRSKSCGSCGRTKHGLTKTPTWNSWAGMRGRCCNSKDDRYRQYGGRGIRICKAWSEFENFLQDMGERPKGTSIDRINNDGNYEPGNCRWATPKQQMRNKQSNVSFRGEHRSIIELSEEFNIPYGRLQTRIYRGWDIETAVITPYCQGQKGKKK